MNKIHCGLTWVQHSLWMNQKISRKTARQCDYQVPTHYLDFKKTTQKYIKYTGKSILSPGNWKNKCVYSRYHTGLQQDVAL